VNNK
jgi:hypothetical protein